MVRSGPLGLASAWKWRDISSLESSSFYQKGQGEAERQWIPVKRISSEDSIQSFSSRFQFQPFLESFLSFFQVCHVNLNKPIVAHSLFLIETERLALQCQQKRCIAQPPNIVTTRHELTLERLKAAWIRKTEPLIMIVKQRQWFLSMQIVQICKFFSERLIQGLLLVIPRGFQRQFSVTWRRIMSLPQRYSIYRMDLLSATITAAKVTFEE